MLNRRKTRSELEVYERLLKEDRMTGINNRTAFEEQLQDIEDHAQDYDNAALIFMDVDGLKNQTIFMDIMQGTTDHFCGAMYKKCICNIWKMLQDRRG